MSQLAFSLRSRRRHPHAIASIAICGDPDGLGFLRVAPVSLSHQPSRGPSSVWFVGTLARAATASCCSFVSTIADSIACSILATVLLSLSSYSDCQLPLVSIIFKLLLYALFSIRVTRLSPLSVGNRIVQFNWSRGKVERESNENCLVLFYLSCLRGYSRGVSFVPSARTMN